MSELTSLYYDWNVLYQQNSYLEKWNRERLDSLAGHADFFPTFPAQETLKEWLSCAVFHGHGDAANRLLDLLGIEGCGSLKERLALYQLNV